MNDAVRTQIENLRNEKTKALKARYRELFGEDSHSSNHAHLFRRIAWRLQALAEGDLSERARQRAVELAVDVDIRLRPPREFWKELASGSETPPRDARLPPSGTVLTRQFQGRLIRAKVLDDGFEYAGRKYQSLSSITLKVTGTRWNGFTFFGLTKEFHHE
jgi:Protein of unknown function (DUF2924)